ncbi:hypothetical protein KY285_032887 [Solanum tuberosum]|nr:hypothetical protein KY289_032999 [Solanum tuberosum]KAH0647639.1 hypothetical protein KY285_032887 [Solanum tuberosum]
MLMDTLTTMKFDGSRTKHEHVIEMTNVAARLRSLGMEVKQNFLVQFIINSLPSKYGGNKAQESRNHSINFVSHQGAGKKGKKHAKGNQRHHNVSESSSQVHKKEHKNDKCHFCGKSGHFQKDCLKFKAWLEKKDKPSAFTCLESYLTEVPYNT